MADASEPGSGRVALYYHDDAFRVPKAGSGPESLLKGRHIAGREFLTALLNHGAFTELTGVTATATSAKSLAARWQQLPAERRDGRGFRIVPAETFTRSFLPDPPAPVLHFPNPPDARYAWVRQTAGRPGFAISGVTLTICSEVVIRAMCDYVTAPVEEFDALVCISKAVVAVMRSVADTYAAYLGDRFGGKPRLRMRLEHIPLGVDPDRFRPPTADERAASRALVGAAADEVVVLCVGRVAFHAKANPFPLYAGIAEAARRTGRAVQLVLAGKPPNKLIEDAFRDGAAKFAPGVRVTLFDGDRPDFDRVWWAADVFTLLSDNIQESFGQAIAEGMACGLPVVTTDWDGCRDLVDDQSGFLVPTFIPHGGAADATTRLVLGELNYDHFLAITTQVVAVDIGRTAEAFARLIGDPALRARMGAAARERAVREFSWAGVIRAYERLWADQARAVAAVGAKVAVPAGVATGPACYPALSRSFAAFPTRVLGESDRVQAVLSPPASLGELLRHALTSHFAAGRVTDERVLNELVARAAAPVSLGELAVFLGGRPQAAADTVGWLLKYGVLRVVEG